MSTSESPAKEKKKTTHEIRRPVSWTPSALQPLVARHSIYTVLIPGQSAFQGLHIYYLVHIPHYQSLRKAASHLGGTEAQKAEL